MRFENRNSSGQQFAGENRHRISGAQRNWPYIKPTAKICQVKNMSNTLVLDNKQFHQKGRWVGVCPVVGSGATVIARDICTPPPFLSTLESASRKVSGNRGASKAVVSRA